MSSGKDTKRVKKMGKLWKNKKRERGACNLKSKKYAKGAKLKAVAE
jgi:hypothetical protein